MRIIHTSDLHLGKRTERICRLQEQESVLGEIIQHVKSEKADLVLIAGDVFDNTTPSGNAEELFYEFVCDLSAHAKVVVIPGNHDDAVKLCASSPLALRNNIYMLGDLTSERRRGVEAFGNGFIRLGANGESATIAYLPYPVEGRIMRELNETAGEETFSKRVGRWLNLGASGFLPSTVNICMSHLFVSGSAKSGDEQEIELGTARLISPDDLPCCDYFALGHVHRAQKTSSSKNAYYSGAILQYSFSDVGTGMDAAESAGEKSVYLVDAVAGKKCEVKKIGLSCGKRLIRLSANSVAEADELCNLYSNRIIELTLNLNEPLTESDSRLLAKPHVAKRRLVLPNVELPEFANRASRTPSEIFTAFYKSKYGTEPSSQLLALFLELAQEN